ncbi:hypothetical protein NP493_1684g00008 [Ridgeia piscesae]|uniref:Uncharacterized protein n=1 Tax=Ridgeia piscesae TaxID=27915 RepID=A0AAD9N7N8_RIDPI|nr:hypothetical protein NP493_1684g00008 [Ridgeia piscesae]
MTKRREMVGNCDNKQRIEYAEICKSIKQKARGNISKYNHEIIRETIMASKSLNKVRAPTLDAEEDIKDQFYSQLDHVLTAVPMEDNLILLGDFNVGRDSFL